MGVLKVVRLGDPSLRLESTAVSEEEISSPEFQQFLDDLSETCVASNGVGIAAPQVGVNKRVIVVNVDSNNPRYPDRQHFALTVVVNPTVSTCSQDTTQDWEGDLSAGIRGLVPRSNTCTVTGLDRNGKQIELTLTDSFHARVFQHEIDHLNGVFFLDHVTRKETIAELPEWEIYWKDSMPFGINPHWEKVSILLMKLTHDLGAWSAVALIPNDKQTALKCAASYRLPNDWVMLENPLDSNSMNARVFNSQQELVEHDTSQQSPLDDPNVTHHVITASAVVPIEGIGTLEVLADSPGFKFDEGQLTQIRKAADTIKNQIS